MTLELTGRRYGKWEVIRRCGSKNNRARWLARCDCGTEKLVDASSLKAGLTHSCGCVSVKHGSARARAVTKEWQVWASMRRRCRAPSAQCWDRYGGRGIKVCERWQTFENFLADMGPRPSPRHSIDRINNDGNYEPANCRWATPKQQQRNRSSNRPITIAGKTLVLSEWAELAGISTQRLHRRLKDGWPLALAVTLPPDSSQRYAEKHRKLTA